MHLRVVILTAVAICLSAGASVAHDWYPRACCSSKDCFEIDADEIVAVQDGWLIVATGEVVPYGKTRTTPSEAGNTFHRCSINGAPNGNTIGRKSVSGQWCVWTPPLGF